MSRSLAVRQPVQASSAEARLSSRSSSVVMPLRTTETSGWSQSQRSAHPAGEKGFGDPLQIFFITSGMFLARFPPRRGSMITTPIFRSAAYFSPAVPAW